MALSATQRKIISDLLDLGNGSENDDWTDYLFQSRKALTGDGIPLEERNILMDFLKSMDTAMKRMSLYHIGATAARNEEEAQETLQDISGMWNDVCTLLRSPSLHTLNNLSSFSNADTLLAKVNRLNYLKPHLRHDLSSDDDGASRTKRAKVDSIAAPISTSNKFAALADNPSCSSQPTPAEEEEKGMEASEPPEQTTNPVTPRKPRVEPIFIGLTANYRALLQHLNANIVKNQVIGKLVGEHIKIIPGSPDDYRALTNYLKTNSINFHAILLKAEKPMKVLIKGLGSETNTEDIAAELTDLGFVPQYISALRNRTNGNKMPLFHVTLKQTPEWEKIYDVTILQSMYVSVQRFYSTAPKQCYRCQGFGHSSQTCYMPAKCLKCAQGHNTKECTKPRDVKATCCNCKGAHPANYQGCPANPRNKKPQLPFKQRYFQMMKEEKERKKNTVLQNTFRMPDAPLPEVPAWTSRNEKIFLPPGQNPPAPHLEKPANSEKSEQPIASEQPVVAPPTLTKAEKRANSYKKSKEINRRTADQHEEIVRLPTPPSLPAMAPTSSGLSDILGILREFQTLMKSIRLNDLLSLLKDTAAKIKAAPNEMDKLAILLEAANALGQIFA